MMMKKNNKESPPAMNRGATTTTTATDVPEFYEAADIDDLGEGKLLGVEVDGEPVCLARVNGEICAFTDNCTHISGPLSDGDLEGEVLTCPWHGAQFNVRTGKVLRGPARADIMIYPVKIDGQTILVGLPEDNP
jgi:3-phenylpropionate/trans-cinnamate dioxygenase ferredoxin subunit